MNLSPRSTPTGPGSRGGTYHEGGPTSAAYHRAWRAASPEYREREALRNARRRAVARNEDPTLVLATPGKARLTPADFCLCGCGCRAEVVRVCGFCRDGMCE